MHYQKRRLFIGINLTPVLKKRLAQEVESWDSEALIPTNLENFHISVHHLGFVLEDQIPDLCNRLAQAASNATPFDVSFSTVEILESLQNPKMILLSGESSEPLRLLNQEVEKALEVFITERKSFRPHITLAKIKKAKWLRLEEQGKALPKINMCLNLSDPVDTVTLFEITVRDGKRFIDPLATYALGENYE